MTKYPMVEYKGYIGMAEYAVILMDLLYAERYQYRPISELPTCYRGRCMKRLKKEFRDVNRRSTLTLVRRRRSVEHGASERSVNTLSFLIPEFEASIAAMANACRPTMHRTTLTDWLMRCHQARSEKVCSPILSKKRRHAR